MPFFLTMGQPRAGRDYSTLHHYSVHDEAFTGVILWELWKSGPCKHLVGDTQFSQVKQEAPISFYLQLEAHSSTASMNMRAKFIYWEGTRDNLLSTNISTSGTH